MNLRCLVTHVIAAPVVLMSMNVASSAQPSGNSQTSATRVAAEMTEGRLNPAESKAGDTVAIRLSDDLKSNGQLIWKKGTLITGVVRNVSHSELKTHTRSMIEVDWMVPSADVTPVQSVSIALQSVIQRMLPRTAEAVPHRSEVSAAIPVQAKTNSAAWSTAVEASTNPALLSMPSVVAVDHQTSSAIESTLDSSATGPLFKVGHGELAEAGGQESVDLFSHLNNDTVIISPSPNFEISSGAQMELLVGVRK